MPIYMKFPGIGGTGKGNHKGWIELESCQLGVYRRVTDPTGSSINREASAPAVSEIVVTKSQDIASTDLFRQAVDGQGKKVVIDFVASDSKNDVPYLSLELENVLITSFNTSGHGGIAHPQPTESLVLNSTKVTYSTTPVESSKDPKHLKDRASWDLAAGQTKSS